MVASAASHFSQHGYVGNEVCVKADSQHDAIISPFGEKRTAATPR